MAIYSNTIDGIARHIDEYVDAAVAKMQKEIDRLEEEKLDLQMTIEDMREYINDLKLDLARR